MSVEKLFARLTAQSSGPNPKEPGGGKPEFTAADISLIASHAPHMSFHALMVKNCHDEHSLEKLYTWTQDTSLTEWFLNPKNTNAVIQPGQVNRLMELAIIGWCNPNSVDAKTLPSRAKYVKVNHETFKYKYQPHYNFLTGELDYIEEIGRRAVYGFMK